MYQLSRDSGHVSYFPTKQIYNTYYSKGALKYTLTHRNAFAGIYLDIVTKYKKREISMDEFAKSINKLVNAVKSNRKAVHCYTHVWEMVFINCCQIMFEHTRYTDPKKVRGWLNCLGLGCLYRVLELCTENSRKPIHILFRDSVMTTIRTAMETSRQNNDIPRLYL
jgi:hypothetical protein